MLSLTKVKAYLGITVPADDTLLTDFEKEVTKELELKIGRHLGVSAAQKVIFDGPAFHEQITDPEDGFQRSIRLPQPAIQLDTTLSDWVFEYRGSTNLAWTAYSKTHGSPAVPTFFLDTEDPWNVWKEDGSWEGGTRSNRITWDAGYVEDAAPDPIMGMALRMIRAKYLPAAMRTLPINVKSANVRGASVTFQDEVVASYEEFLTQAAGQIRQLRWAV